MAITLEAIRAAGGIVHSDGNIFFRDISMLQGLAGAAPVAVAGPAWDKTRDSLATLLLGLARRPFLDFDVACIALDAATEPGMPLAYMRGTTAAPALDAPAAKAMVGDEQADAYLTDPGRLEALARSHPAGLVRALARAALAAAPQAPAEAQEPAANLHDDGYWTPTKTEAGRALNERLMRAGSPRIPVYTHPAPQQAAPQAPAAPSEIDAREQVTRALGLGADGLIPFAWSYLVGRIEQLVECEAELCALKAAPAAPSIPQWIDDPHDIEQGQMLNPAWAQAQAAPAAPAVDALDADRWRALEGQMDAGRVSLTVHHTEAEQRDGRTISDAGELQDYADSLAAQAAAKGA